MAAAEERAKRRAAAAAARGNVPVFAVGDSVMKASALALADEIGGKVVVNAEEGRAPSPSPE